MLPVLSFQFCVSLHKCSSTVNRLSMTQLASECPVSFEKLLSPFGYFLQGTFISNSTYVGLVNGADITGLGLFIAE
jgi:hypothetical protein